jgi:electron transport complex protein RnfC
MVKPGDHVNEGMLIGKADGLGSAHVHASIPGIVVDVRDYCLPTGQTCSAVTIELGGEFETSGKPRAHRQWDRLSPAEILDRIKSAGVVGLGGESIPTHLKLVMPAKNSSSLLVANGVESEPMLCADEALLHEKAVEIVEGLRICQSLLNPARTVIAIGQHLKGLMPALQQVVRQKGAKAEVLVLSSRYPYGHEQLVLSALGFPPARGGQKLCVLNVATLNAIFEAVVLDKPLIDRVLTVAGSSLAHPQNLKVRFGTAVRELLEECGGLSMATGKIVMGGPMRGVSVDSLDLPVTKATAAVVTLPGPARPFAELPCIRCGSCIEVCPWDLVPTRLFKLVRIGNTAAAEREGISSCTECGCCAYSCPSRIPLVAVLRDGRRALRGPDA